MFTDEARFGRINCPRPCWAPKGVRPGVAAQLIREYTYLYGAVCPEDATCKCRDAILRLGGSMARTGSNHAPVATFRGHSRRDPL